MLTRLRQIAAELGLPAEVLIDEWHERAGIREHDGGAARESADRDAFDDVLERFAVAPWI